MQEVCFYDILLFFIFFWSDLTRCGPMNYNNYYLPLYQERCIKT